MHKRGRGREEGTHSTIVRWLVGVEGSEIALVSKKGKYKGINTGHNDTRGVFAISEVRAWAGGVFQ